MWCNAEIRFLFRTLTSRLGEEGDGLGAFVLFLSFALCVQL